MQRRCRDFKIGEHRQLGLQKTAQIARIRWPFYGFATRGAGSDFEAGLRLFTGLPDARGGAKNPRMAGTPGDTTERGGGEHQNEEAGKDGITWHGIN